MQITNIETVKNPDGTQGYTTNPITGCLNHTPEGLCLGGMFPCYAWKLANGRLKSRYLANKELARWHEPTLGEYGFKALSRALTDPFYPRLWEDRMWLHELVGSKRKPRGIFVCDMSDLFGIGIPEEWIKRVLSVIEKHPRHRFYLLTKQPQNLIKFSPFPDNCWVGVSATDKKMAERALHYLFDIDAKVKYISFEPLLSSIAETDYWLTGLPCEWERIDWAIIGAQTKPYKPPLKIWVDEITEACKKASVPYFLKDNLRPLLGNDLVQDIPKGVGIDH